MSHKMDESWTSKGVEDVCRRSRCVGLKLHAQRYFSLQLINLSLLVCTVMGLHCVAFVLHHWGFSIIVHNLYVCVNKFAY